MNYRKPALIIFYHMKRERIKETLCWRPADKVTVREVKTQAFENGAVVDAIYDMEKGTMKVYTNRYGEADYWANLDVDIPADATECCWPENAR